MLHILSMETARFYVYTLTDPRDGSVFYVGKGQKRRAWDHEAAVRNGKMDVNKRKCLKIKDIIDCDLPVIVSIVARYEKESDAFDHEEELIATTKGALNVLARGGGWSLSQEEIARRLTPEVIAERQEGRRDRLLRQASKRNLAYLKKWAKMANCWRGVTFPGIANGDKLAAEFLAAVNKMVS
jgi:hypothetical protein